MLAQLKTHTLSKYLIYLLLLNFINLSANFYHSSEKNSTLLTQSDPLDSLTEVFFEYLMEMDEDTIPDTEIPTEERSLLDLKMVKPANYWTYNFNISKVLVQQTFYYTDSLGVVHLDIIVPPPKYWI